jgi:hypothetical protein
MRVTTIACLFAVLVCRDARSQVRDRSPSATAGIAGVVRDTLARPLHLVAITALGRDTSVVTDDSGRFALTKLPPGPTSISVLRIGYRPIAFEADLPADSTLMVAIRLQPVTTLAAVVTSAERVGKYLARTGFPERMHMGIGSFLSPEKIDSLSRIVTRPAELLRELRGLDVQCANAGCIVHTRRPPDCLLLFIDGVFADGQIDDQLTVGGIAAIEVYERPSKVPAEFQGKLPEKRGLLSRGAGCGAIAVWTKARAGQTGIAP